MKLVFLNELVVHLKKKLILILTITWPVRVVNDDISLRSFSFYFQFWYLNCKSYMIKYLSQSVCPLNHENDVGACEFHSSCFEAIRELTWEQDLRSTFQVFSPTEHKFSSTYLRPNFSLIWSKTRGFWTLFVIWTEFQVIKFHLAVRLLIACDLLKIYYKKFKM